MSGTQLEGRSLEDRFSSLGVFKTPLCLISTDEHGKLQIQESVLSQIRQIDVPLNIVGVCGLYRSGKSYLMKHLVREKKGYGVGATTKPHTKGIWAWCKVHPTQDNQIVLVLDTEGLADIKKGNVDNHNQLFSLTLLLCSTLIYNMQGVFNQDAVDKLSFTTKLSEQMQVMGTNNNNEKCFTLSLPVAGKKLRNVEACDDSQLDEDFIHELDQFRDFIFQQKQKMLDEFPQLIVDGTVFATVTSMYVDQLRKGSPIKYRDTFEVIAKQENKKIMKMVLVEFDNDMTNIILPVNQKILLQSKYMENKEKALHKFRKSAYPFRRMDFENKASEYMQKKYEEIQRENSKMVKEDCSKVLSNLYEDMVEARSEEYVKEDGYTVYKNNMIALEMEFNTKLKEVDNDKRMAVWLSMKYSKHDDNMRIGAATIKLADEARYDRVRNFNRDACRQTSNGNVHSDVSERRTCIHYSVSAKCWPRVYKSQQVIKDLVNRCSYIEGLFGLPSHQEEQVNLLDIDVYIDSTVASDITSFLVRCDRFERKGMPYIHVSQRNILEESFSLRENFAGIFIDREGVKLVEAISSEQINVVKEKESFAEQQHQFELRKAKPELSSLLEQVVFEILTVKFNILKQFYENKMHGQFDKQSLRLCMSAEEKTDVGIESSYSDVVTQHKDIVEQLLGEMVAFFKRSTLPENKRPVFLGFEKKEVSKEVKEQLFGLDKTIRGCGYSYCTFNVNVERLSDEEETMNRKKRITHFLKGNGITNIKFNIVSESVADYKHVGARISVPGVKKPSEYHKGTLGGFASFSKENETSSCALFSRHVALGCSAKLYVDGDNGQLTEFGEILEDTLKHGSYDIAAAKIHEGRVSECDFQFKNSENVPLPGKLYKSATDLDLQHLPVHLFGSKSKPGLGIIKIPELNYPEATETYIQIEDRDPSGGQVLQRMAVEGDSGAIVCADDLDDENVHVISMLIGSNTEEMRRENPNEKATYITFPVKKGVELLQSKTNGIFLMKGVNNDEQNVTK